MDENIWNLQKTDADTDKMGDNVAVPIEVTGTAAESSSGSKGKLQNGLLDPVLVDSRTSVVSQSPSGSTLSFHQLSYSVKVKSAKGCGQIEKYIIKNVNGLSKPGMNAILGPTGSGKSSLLDILAARKDVTGLTGKVLVDGAPQPHNFKCMTGYVIQDDIVMGMLTVRENIEFSAALRLPSNMSASQRAQRVDDVIEELGLAKCAGTKVGTAFMRGVSGGERKRTNIAMELIIAPSVLFLDEPTTGLDANTAHSVMVTLKKLSLKGKTVIFSIHQPRYSIYKLFDHLNLLSRGQCVYEGPATEALTYFQSIGYVCEEHNNPSDFFLDVIQGGLSPVQDSNEGDLVKPTEQDTLSLLIEMEPDDEEGDLAEVRQKLLTDRFNDSTWRSKLETSLAPIWDQYESLKTSTSTKSIAYPTSFCTQLCVLSQRTFRNMIRNPHTLITQIFSAIVLGLIVGAIYYQIDTSYTSGIQNRVGVFFFIVMNYVFGNMAAVDIFIKERALFIHENVSGFYRVSSYFLSKLFCDVIPTRLLPILVFSAIAYWMIGLQPDASKFFFFVLNIFLTSLAGTAVALIFSATVNLHTIGTILTALVWVFMMVFSGLLVNLNTIGHWVRWIKWLSIFRYSMNAFSVNELKDLDLCNSISEPGDNITQLCDHGNNYMSRQGIPYKTTFDLWVNELALFLLALAFLVITYVQLRRIKKIY